MLIFHSFPLLFLVYSTYVSIWVDNKQVSFTLSPIYSMQWAFSHAAPLNSQEEEKLVEPLQQKECMKREGYVDIPVSDGKLLMGLDSMPILLWAGRMGFSYMQGSAGWPGLRNHLYSYILDWGHCYISRAWWERGKVKEVRGWGDRTPSTGLVHALQTTGNIWKGG